MKTKWWNYNDNISKFYPPKQRHFQRNFAQNMKACRKIYNLSYSFPREDDDYGNVFSKFLHSQIPLWYICLNHFRCQGFQYYFLAHLSWKLKWAFLITCRPSSVCLSVCVSVRPSINFSHFHLLLQNHWANFNQTWHKASLGEGDSSLFKWRAPPFCKGR